MELSANKSCRTDAALVNVEAGEMRVSCCPCLYRGSPHHCYEAEHKSVEPVYLEDLVIGINRCVF